MSEQEQAQTKPTHKQMYLTGKRLGKTLTFANRSFRAEKGVVTIRTDTQEEHVLRKFYGAVGSQEEAEAVTKKMVAAQRASKSEEDGSEKDESEVGKSVTSGSGSGSK